MNEEHLPQLIMRRADLQGLPPLDLPEGYALHRCDGAFTDNERDGIARVLGESFPEMTWFGERVDSTFIGDTSCHTTFYIEHVPSGAVVATATAREDPSFPDAGYLHWVGVSPAHRGKRLGNLVSLAVLYEFVATGFHGAVLTTDDHRLAAIKTYLTLGFVPLPGHASHEARWQAVQTALQPSK
ncbi:MAG: GNAT family N-acetyltransferase [Fibrella sp.]|nr:GNAT family N-acetyltransferase [Armatimonadota bacterium]